MDKTVFYIAKKEYIDNFRNYWIIALSIIFAILIIVISYFGSAGSASGWRALDETINLLKTPVEMIVPIVSLILGYAAIVREVENGSMSSLLSFPVKRFEVILGKFLGLGLVLTSIIFIGFIISGVIIGVNTAPADYTTYFLFIGATIILGLDFLSISIFFSSIFKRRTTSMGAVIFLWIFFAIIFPMIIAGITFSIIMGGNEISTEFIGQIMLINPLMTISNFNVSNAPEIQWITLSYLAWLIVPLILSFVIFEKKDI